MLRKIWFLLFWFLSLTLVWCSWWASTLQSWLPEVFSVVPDDFDQILYFDIDADLLELMETQYGANTPVSQEFARIESVVLWQKLDGAEGESLLFVEGKDVDVQQLAALWLVALDPAYETRALENDIQVYGLVSSLDAIDFDWIQSSDLAKSFWKILKQKEWNFWFISSPSNSGLGWLAIQFANKLIGTVWVLSLWNKLPSGEAHMLFKDGVVKEWTEEWTSLSNSTDTPLSLSTNNISWLLWLDSAMLQTFLPLILQPVLGDGASLLSSADIKKLVQSLAWTLSVSFVPNILWMWRRLAVDTPDAFWVFENMYPVLDGYIKSTLFSWTNIELVKEDSLISWNTDLPTWSWDNISFPLIEIQKDPDITTLSFMMVDDLAWPVTKWTSHPWSTIAVWLVDFLMLTQMMWVEAGEIVQAWADKLKLEMIADEGENIIRVELK